MYSKNILSLFHLFQDMDCWPPSHEEKKIVGGWLRVFCVFWKSSEKTLQVSNFCYISLDSVEPRYCFP
jgi:hypothetical protein